MKPFKFLKSIFGNTILLVSVYLMSPGLSYAQTYHPIIDTNKYWMVKITGSNYPCCPYSILETFYFSGDTLINNLTYKKLMQNNIKLSDTTLKKTTIYAGSLREDTAIRKIYFIYPNNVNTLEKIIYDFSLNIGDSVTFFYTGRGVQKGIIDSIDFVKINNVCTKRYFIKEGINSEGWMDIWIEGIGSLFGLVYPGMSGIDFGPYFGLSLAKQNQDTKY